MKHTQLLPILVIDILTGAFFGLLKSHHETTEVIPLFITAALYAVLGVISVLALISLPLNRRSTTLILLLCLMRVCEFTLAIITQLTDGEHFYITQVWLGTLEYVIAIFLLVRIPTEYFAHVNLTYFPAFDDHRIIREDIPREGRSFIAEGPHFVNENLHAPLAASGGFTEIDFQAGSINISSELMLRQQHKPQKLPHPKNIRRREVSPGSSPPESPDPEEALKKQPLDLLRPPQLLLFLEKFCVSAICIISGSICLISLVGVKDVSYWDSNVFVNVVLVILTWCNLGVGVMLLFVQIVKLQKITFPGYFFGSTHAHGVVLMISLVGFIVSFAYSFLTLLVGTPMESYLPNTGENSFISCAKAIFTQGLPLAFHYHNIFSDKHYRPSNVSARMKVAFFLVVVNVHWMVVGHVFTQGDVSTAERALATSARAAALASAIDFCFVLMALLSPLAHTFIQFFNLGIMRLSIHQIHLHRSMVVSGSIFALLHITLHVIAWCIAPDLAYDGVHLYRVASVPYISGVAMLVGLVGSGISGYELAINVSAPISSLLHLPFTVLFFVALFVHGHEHIMGEPLGDYMVLTTFMLCVGSYIIFFFALPVRRKEVDFRQSTWGDVIRENEDHFLFLSLKYGNSSTIPPGSFFTLYGIYGSLLSYTHGHPFPVFSSRNGNVDFLIHCRKAKTRDQITFTQQLLVMRPELVYVQGPFQGPATAFVESLGNLSSPTHLFLCGWNAGFSNVFAILEHLKDFGPTYAIKSISCAFNHIANTEVRKTVLSKLGRLVCDWESPIPVSIVETPDKDLRHVLAMAERQNKQIFKNKQELMELWRENLGGFNRWVVMKESKGEGEGEAGGEEEGDAEVLSRRRRSGTFGDSGKVLYFCGNHFNYEMFGEGWTCHVETISF